MDCVRLAQQSGSAAAELLAALDDADFPLDSVAKNL
jgi:hypothetical protein